MAKGPNGDVKSITCERPNPNGIDYRNGLVAIIVKAKQAFAEPKITVLPTRTLAGQAVEMDEGLPLNVIRMSSATWIALLELFPVTHILTEAPK